MNFITKTKDTFLGDYPKYSSYRSGFIVGTGCSFGFTPIYPTNFINSYVLYSEPAYIDSLGIFYDWAMIGEDINTSIINFEKENRK